MFNIYDLEGKLKEVNGNLRNKYAKYFKVDKKDFKKSLEEKVGKISKIQKLSKEDLEKIDDLVGVDGSSNRCGGAFPHYIEIFQGLAKSTKYKEKYLSEVYTPTLNESYEEEEKGQQILATIEIDTAIEYIKNKRPDILMMDGGFIRYKINCQDRFTDLRNLCQEKNILLFGVIKDIKTQVISGALNFKDYVYDRELLFNTFEVGEALLINNEVNKKYIEKGLGEGFSSAFLRSSSFPGCIGIDILDIQEKYLPFVLSLVYTLTPFNSRGVPLWLDIVDKDVKITDQIIRASLETYLDRDIYERFFISERDKRSL